MSILTFFILSGLTLVFSISTSIVIFLYQYKQRFGKLSFKNDVILAEKKITEILKFYFEKKSKELDIKVTLLKKDLEILNQHSIVTLTNLNQVKKNLEKLKKIDKKVLEDTLSDFNTKLFLLERSPVNTDKLRLIMDIKKYNEFYKSSLLHRTEIKKILEIDVLTNNVINKIPYILKQYSETLSPDKILDSEFIDKLWNEGLSILKIRKII
jgi:hypothetical protein